MKRLILCVPSLAAALAVASGDIVVADLSVDDAVFVSNWACVDGALVAEDGFGGDCVS